MVDYQAVVVDLLHCLHRRGYPPTKEDIMALNSSHYKAHNCRGMANVRRIVSRLHFGVQNNKPPHWVLESPNMMEIFKLVVIDCKKNFKSNDKAYQDGLTKAVRSRLVPANLPRLVKKELEPVDRSRPMPASLPHLLKREPEPVERSRLVPGSPLRLAKKELEPVDSGIPKSEELVRLKQHIRCLETKLQAKEMEIDELKTRCETRNDRLHVQSMQIQELLYTVEQKNQEIVILEDRVMTMEQMAAATRAI